MSAKMKSSSVTSVLRAAELGLLEAENRLKLVRGRRRGRSSGPRDQELLEAVKQVVEARHTFHAAHEAWVAAAVKARGRAGPNLVLCANCGEAADSSVAVGPRGPFVVVACHHCAHIWAPYDGPARARILDYWLMERPSGGEWVTSGSESRRKRR